MLLYPYLTSLPLPWLLMHNFGLLPIELQASVTELREAGIPDSALAVLIERMFSALQAKSTKVQLDVWKIEESLNTRIERIGDKLAGDLRTQHGATNGMLVDIRGAQIEQGAAVAALRAEFHDGMQAIGERVSDLEGRTTSLEQTVAAHNESRDTSIAERRALREDMNQSKQHRAHMQEQLDTELPAIRHELASLAAAIKRIERRQVDGQHEAGE